MPIKFLDMFAGIGGFRSGLERLGGFECVGYCEIDKYAKQAYDAIYPTEGELYFAEVLFAAYCRVSTAQDEQLNSYEVQKNHYEERIRTEPKWTLVGIFADKGITGTSMKKRDEFNKMLRLCYKVHQPT